MKDDSYHEPVLVSEVLEELELNAPLKKKVQVIDATLGTGGHTLRIKEKSADVLGIEADPEMLEIAKSRLGTTYPLVYGNFKDIDKIAKENSFEKIDAVLFDLGVSNLQLTSLKRGFSFSNTEALLDMRIDTSIQGVTGADLLNALRKDQLEDLFGVILDYSSSRWLTKNVLQRREITPFKTVGDFLEVCRGLRGKPGINPATLPFLALRIAVNSELENISEALVKAFNLLKTGGKLLVITFHSKEEKVILDYFKSIERENKGFMKGPIKPSGEEVEKNPRSRSAELFVLTKSI